MFLLNEKSKIIHILDDSYYNFKPMCGAASWDIKKFIVIPDGSRFCEMCMKRLSYEKQQFFKRALKALNRIAKEVGI